MYTPLCLVSCEGNVLHLTSFDSRAKVIKDKNLIVLLKTDRLGTDSVPTEVGGRDNKVCCTVSEQ